MFTAPVEIPNFPEPIDWYDVSDPDDCAFPMITGDPIFIGPDCIGVYDWQIQWVLPIIATT